MTDKEPGNKKEKAALDPEKFFNEKEYNTICTLYVVRILPLENLSKKSF